MLKWKALVVSIAFFPTLLLAFSSGPPTGVTGGTAGGSTEPNCSDCHTSNAVNAPGGAVTISGVPANYTPGGPAIPITVTVTKSGQRRWGFELAVKVNSTGAQAGTLATAQTTERIQTDPTTSIQYIEHNSSGTQIGASQGTWTFNWTPPATNVGQITFMAAGNAANGDGTSSGDFIYITQTSSLAQAQTTSPFPSKPVLTFLPHFATGAPGFVTRVFVTNVSNSSNGVVVNFINQSGQLATQRAEQILAPGAGFQIPPDEANRNASPISVEWLAIGSDGPISASDLFDCCAATSTIQTVGVLGQLQVTNPPLTFKAPFAFQNDDRTLNPNLPVLTEGIAIANLTSQSNTITLTLLDGNGTQVAQDQFTLDVFNQRAFSPPDLSPNSLIPTISNFLKNQGTFFGSLRITGTQAFAPVYVGNLGTRLFTLPLTGQ